MEVTMSSSYQQASRWFLALLVLIIGFSTTPASAQAGLDYATYQRILDRDTNNELDQSIHRARASAESFDLRSQGRSVVRTEAATSRTQSEQANASMPEPQERLSRVDRSSINIVAEVGVRARIAEFRSDPWQPRGVKHVRVSVELALPGKHIVPYVALGRWDNVVNRNYVPDQWTPPHTTFAVVGVALRSRGNPEAGQVVFQANAGFGRTWGRDQRRTTAKHIFEGTISASYHITRRMALRVGYAHYSTGEGVFLNPGGYFRNYGEGRLTMGLTLRV